MSEKPIGTIAGPFDRARLEQLKETLEKADGAESTMFEGQELHCGFGKYLVEFVEGQFAQRGHEGL